MRNFSTSQISANAAVSSTHSAASANTGTLKARLSTVINLKRTRFVVGSLLLLMLSVLSADKSYAVATRTVALSGGGNATTGICQGTANQVVYTFTVVAGGTANSILTDFNFTTSGTGAGTTDIVGYTLWSSASGTLTGAQYMGYIANSGAATQTFPAFNTGTAPAHTLTTGSTYSYFVLANYATNAVSGHVLNIAALGSGNFSWTAAPTTFSGSASAGSATVGTCACKQGFAYTGAVQT